MPAGTWIDYTDGKIYAGKQNVTVAVDSTNWDDVPLFVKKGAIIPTQDFMNYVGEKPVNNIYLDVFPDTEETSFNYYDDDGITYDYEKGLYFKQTITSLYNKGSEALSIGAKTGSYTPELQYYIARVHMISNAPVTVDGQQVTEYGSYTELLNAGGEGWAAGTDTYGDVVYVKVAAGNGKNIVIPGTIPDPPSPPEPVFKYEAENAVISNGAGINSNHSGYSGDGFVDGYQNSGATTTFNVNVSAAGSYSLDLRYANAMGAGKTVSIYINGVKLKSAAFPNLPNWDTWSNVVETITLNSGNNTITYKYDAGDTGNINLDYIILTSLDAEPPTTPEELKSTGKSESTVNLSWIASTDNMNVAGYTIYRDGTAVNSNLITETIYTDNGLSPGKTYSYYVKATDTAGNQSQASDTINAATDSLGRKATIYYKRGYSTPYIHYTQADGNWTTPPGVPMKDCGNTYSGYSVINDIDMGTNTALQACFNNGSGSWDNNGGKNYTFSSGTYTIANGMIYEGAPKSVRVTFTVNNAYTTVGQNVYITGNIAELGNWAPASAAGPALCPNYPTWTLTMALPAGQAIEFKVIKKDGAGNVTWESGNICVKIY